MDHVWAQIVLKVSSGQLGPSAKVGREDRAGKAVCCVYVNNWLDQEEVERVRENLQDLLRSLVAEVTIMLKPDIFTHCNIYANNPWNIPVSIATCEIRGSATTQDVFQQDRDEISRLAEAVMSNSLEAVTPRLEDADAWGALLGSLHWVALRPNSAHFCIPDICAALPDEFRKHFKLQLVYGMAVGLVRQRGALICKQSSRLFSYPEFVRLHLANFDLLSDLCLCGIIGPRVLRGLRHLLCEDTPGTILPTHSTWAFIQTTLQSFVQKLEIEPELGGWVQPRVISEPEIKILTLNVWCQAECRELRTSDGDLVVSSARAGSSVLAGGHP